MRRLAPLLAALALASGCLSAISGLEAPVTDPDRIASVTETELHVEPAVLTDHANVTVHMHLDEPIAFTDNGGGGDWRVWIEDDGTQVTRLVSGGPQAGAAVIHEATMDAGDHAWTFPWNGRTEPPSGNGSHGGPRVEPGIYEVHAVRGEIDVRFQASGTIEVAPAEG